MIIVWDVFVVVLKVLVVVFMVVLLVFFFLIYGDDLLCWLVEIVLNFCYKKYVVVIVCSI